MSAVGPYRLPCAKRTAAVSFRFNGRVLTGIAGDTVASALLANGIRILSRSFKYHRPRGIFSAGIEEPNAIVQVHSGAHALPCARATVVTLRQDMEVFSGGAWPTLSLDLLRGLDFAHGLFAAGFYNKTFKWPSWHFYEPWIRRMAGFGHAPVGADPDRYETHFAHCEVLVIGGGAAGNRAAQAASQSGKRVLLVDSQNVNAPPGTSLGEDVQRLPHTTAVAIYDHHLVALVEAPPAHRAPSPRERLWLVRAQRIVLATGAIEQPLIFDHNDRPGIMLAGGALNLMQHHGIAPGRSVVVATNNDTAYAVARELRQSGVNVVALADSRATNSSQAQQELAQLGIEVLRGMLPVSTGGFGALKQVSLGKLDGTGGVAGQRKLACDALLVSGGWSPALQLFGQAGGTLQFSPSQRTFVPSSEIAGVDVAGSGTMSVQGALGERISPIGNPARQWVDLRHDVTVADLELAVRENFTAIEHIKRHTTLGMSVDQGKCGQAVATEAIARVRRIHASEMAHTSFRPPFVPVTLGNLVGRQVGDLFAPIHRSPLHALQSDAGALLEYFGDWERAAAFPKGQETRSEAIRREVKLIREDLGLFDASPLGKIEIQGPDALEFTDLFYIQSLASLKPEKVRYGIMLRETGIIFDDGTVVLRDPEHVLLTTTSSGAARVAAWLEEWHQCEWPQLRVVITPVTDQWATVALTGHAARTVLAALKPACDLSNATFPHLGFRETTLLGMQARIYRVSFSGELTYEINVPAHQAPKLWSALLEEGRAFGIDLYGVEALLRTRLEKGYIHIGSDTDGTTVPEDIGFGKPAASKASHYVGKRSLSLPENIRPDRLQLVGLTDTNLAALPVGSHLRLKGSTQPTDGWITSAGHLSINGKPIALAMLRAGRSQLHQTASVHDAGAPVGTARVVPPVFYDADGSRLHA